MDNSQRLKVNLSKASLSKTMASKKSLITTANLPGTSSQAFLERVESTKQVGMGQSIESK